MKDTKTVWRSFIPWQYDAEAAVLDGMSERGWQLQSLGLHKRTYVRDGSVRYRYALDLHKEEPRPDYFELFRDQGWERVCACRNSDGSGAAGWWYVFRKKYDPALPEEEYRIYTDRPSLEEMKGRWSAHIWGWLALLAVWGTIFVLQPSMFRLLIVLWWLAMLLLWTARRRALRRAASSP